MSNEQTIAAVLQSLVDGKRAAAQTLLESSYPFHPVEKVQRSYTPRLATEVFVRDGFIDRYSGQRLVFPGALRTISLALPEAFPYQVNWKMAETHFAYWELCPTVDHVVPVARGGQDEAASWVTTSQLRNSAKSSWTLEELGWSLHPPGAMSDWDGLCSAFLDYVAQHAALLEHRYLRSWHRALVAVLGV